MNCSHCHEYLLMLPNVTLDSTLKEHKVAKETALGGCSSDPSSSTLLSIFFVQKQKLQFLALEAGNQKVTCSNKSFPGGI